MGLFSFLDKKSSNQTSSTTTNETLTDKRIVADAGGIGISGDGVTLGMTDYNVLTMTDGGALLLARDVANAGLSTGQGLGGMALASARDLGGMTLASARDLGGSALSTARDLGDSVLDAGRAIALAGLSDNATNVGHLLDTADHLFAAQQKVVDLNAGLASALASKATGTQDTGIKTAGALEEKQLLIIGGAVLLLALVLAQRGRA